jgi:adenine-specific DNA methylase
VLPLSEASVDYAFTDPPYGGEGIQYGELSLLWSLWLGDSQDLSREIAFNPHRKLSQEHYEAGLVQVFAETFRVLKPGAFLTVTFANKDPQVWDALLRACRDAGFRLVTAAPMKRSLPSLTETNMHSAPKADLVLNFERPRVWCQRFSHESTPYSLEEAVQRIAGALAREGEVRLHDVFDRVLVDWFSWLYTRAAGSRLERPTLARIERPTLARIAALLNA